MFAQALGLHGTPCQVPKNNFGRVNAVGPEQNRRADGAETESDWRMIAGGFCEGVVNNNANQLLPSNSQLSLCCAACKNYRALLSPKPGWSVRRPTCASKSIWRPIRGASRGAQSVESPVRVTTRNRSGVGIISRCGISRRICFTHRAVGTASNVA